MPITQAEFRMRLEALVNKFQANAAEYLSADYSEAQARRQFIDPLFAALGWDLEDRQGLGPARCEVWMEKGETVGKPDYNFRVNAQTKFFAEAKAPHVKLSGPHILQAKRYAWNHADVSFSVLTDFEEFRLYDATLKPDPEHPDLGLIFHYRYAEYLTDAALADLWKLSRDEVAAESLDKLLKQDAASRRKRVPVDKSFLADLTDWRELLAKDAFKHDSNLDVRTLNEAVQVLLDRLIFIRIAEDRRIIEAESLRKLVEQWSQGKHRSLRAMLNRLFQDINDDLNGEVFKPNAALDAATFDDALVARIVHGLTDGPYDFAVIGVELLGSIYERYLGKTIRVTVTRAIVEDKPEVRKAGGVYYTPKYIVDYIVEQTVGKLIEGKTPAQIAGDRKGAPLRVLDPACGSGSFLLAAYRKLIDYHVAYYAGHPQEARQGELFPFLIDAGQTNQRLSIEKKAEILTNNIFGVDIDPQAVEITMMSLYIKALEGETTLPHKHGLLPSLKNNIKCGNSLIGPDYFEGQMMPDADELARVKPFDWEGEFPQVFHPGGARPAGGTRRGARDEGGFDCVIGNPPYGATIGETEAQYLRAKFETANKDLDTYALFMEQAVHMCKPRGKISLIVPTGWYSGVKFSNLRRFAACTTDPEVFVNLPYDIFGAWVDTSVFVVCKRSNRIIWPRSVACKVQLRTFPKRHRIAAITEFEEELHSADFAEWFSSGNDEFLTYADSTDTLLIRKIQDCGKPLNEFADVQRGVTPFNLTESPTHRTCRPAFNGTVRRYSIQKDDTRYIRFDSTLAEPKPERYFQGPRLLLRELISRQFRLQSVKVTEDFVTNKSMQSILQLEGAPDLNYLLGLLNGRLMSWYFLRRSNIAQRDDFPKIVLKETRSLPIHPINFSDPADVARHDRMVSLVERMLELHKRLASARASADRDLYQRQIEATDRQIDALVYELYGLTEDEIKIVEGD